MSFSPSIKTGSDYTSVYFINVGSYLFNGTQMRMFLLVMGKIIIFFSAYCLLPCHYVSEMAEIKWILKI